MTDLDQLRSQLADAVMAWVRSVRQRDRAMGNAASPNADDGNLKVWTAAVTTADRLRKRVFAVAAKIEALK